VRAGHTFRELLEELTLDLDKLFRVDDVQYLLDLSQVHYLLGAVGLGPEPQETVHNLEESGEWKSQERRERR
jgi:hypothetical protein